MNVSEAKKKICPFISTYYPSALNNKQRGFINCICGDCMAWVTTYKEITSKQIYGVAPEGYEHTRKSDDGFLVFKALTSEEGYCQKLKG